MPELVFVLILGGVLWVLLVRVDDRSRRVHWKRLWHSATELWQTDPSEWWFFWLVSFEDRVVAACASTDASAASRRVWLYGGFHNMWEARRWWHEHFTKARPQAEVDRVRGYVFGARKRVRAQHN